MAQFAKGSTSGSRATFCPPVDTLELLQFRSEIFWDRLGAPPLQDYALRTELRLINELLELSYLGPITLDVA